MGTAALSPEKPWERSPACLLSGLAVKCAGVQCQLRGRRREEGEEMWGVGLRGPGERAGAGEAGSWELSILWPAGWWGERAPHHPVPRAI